MGGEVFLVAALAHFSGPALAHPLRVWGRRIQWVAGVLVMLVGMALLYSSADPGFFDRLLLPH